MEADTSIGYFEGPASAVIEALIGGGFEGAMLELDGDILEDFDEFIETINAAYPHLADGNRRASEAFRIGPIGFGIGPHRVPIEGDNLARLAALADPGFIVELAVRDAEGALVYAHDVSNGEIWVSDRVPVEAVARMRAVLGAGLRPPPPGPA